MKKKKDDKPIPGWAIAIFFILLFDMIKTCIATTWLKHTFNTELTQWMQNNGLSSVF